jgi:predicted esterase
MLAAASSVIHRYCALAFSSSSSISTATWTRRNLAAAMSSSTSTAAASSGGGGDLDITKPRILCLHGKFQSGATFSNKIAGARRKLARVYDLEFLNGPLRLVMNDQPNEEPAFAWWQKEDDGRHVLVREGLEHVLHHMQSQTRPYQAIIGFSQGGVLATALASAGLVPSLKAVVTAGSPMVPEAFEAADQIGNECSAADANAGYNLPKLHFAGETDAMIPVESTRLLCERGGNGTFLVHDQGHLFPTRAARVQEVLDFLEQHLFQIKVG